MTAALARMVPAGSPATFDELAKMAEMFFRSGYFTDAKSAGAALVKIQAGRELGFGPMASMTGVHVIEGKPSIGAHLFAAMIRSSGRYDYEVIESTKERCELKFTRLVGKKWVDQTPSMVCTLKEFIENGTAISGKGKSGEPPPLKTNWQRSPDDMLFARAISKGYRRHCPDLSCGVSVYVTGEIDSDEQPPAATNGSVTNGPAAGEVVDASYTVNGHHVTDSAPTTATTTTATEEPRQTLQEALAIEAAKVKASQGQFDRLAELMKQLNIAEPAALARARELYGIGSWSDLTEQNADDMESKMVAAVAQLPPAKG